MESSKKRLLEALPGWSWDPRLDSTLKKYDVYLTYIADKKTLKVPQDLKYEGVLLGRFIHNVKTWHRTGKIRSELKKKFENIYGWEW